MRAVSAEANDFLASLGGEVFWPGSREYRTLEYAMKVVDALHNADHDKVWLRRNWRDGSATVIHRADCLCPLAKKRTSNVQTGMFR